MSYGGYREGAGRPKGSKNKATLEKIAVSEAFNQRVMNQADALFNAQFSLAVGSARVFRIDDEEDGGKKRKVHVLVTDPDEIKELLNTHDGGNGEIQGRYYYITTAAPDNRALDSLLNRALGKAPEKIEILQSDADAFVETAAAPLPETFSDLDSDKVQ